MSTIQLGGCAGAHHYMFGVGAYIEESYIIDTSTRLRSISASNFVCAAILSTRSTRSISQLWSRRLADLRRHRPWTGLYYLSAMMEDHIRHVLQFCTLERSKQHHIRITVLDTLRSIWAHDHTNLLDYCNALQAGAFLPGICGRFWYMFRNRRCVDGGLPKIQFYRNKPAVVDTISISVFDSPTISKWYMLWLIVYGIWSSTGHHDLQFALGYAHARDVLQPSLDKLLVRRESPLRKLAIEGGVRWDQTNRTFT